MDQEQTSAATEPDYDHLLKSNLERVFNERDAEKRFSAIRELFVDEPVMFEPRAVVKGREAISAIAGDLLTQFGPGFRFEPLTAGVGHHGVGTLRWRGGDAGRMMVTGFDTAEVVDGKISKLWVLIDAATKPADAA